MTIRALLFDADEVLQYPTPSRNADLVRVLGFMPEPVAEFIGELHATEDTTLAGALDFLEVLPAMLARWGAADKAREVREWLNIITVDHDMLELVSELRQRGYRCALATNQQQHRAAFMADQLGYRALFDRCFFSCAMGVAKPDPRYFQAMLMELQLEPDQAVFIDDKPVNVRAASALGIQSVCFANAKDGRASAALRSLLARLGVACDANV